MKDETTPEQFINLIKTKCPVGFSQFYEKYSSWLYGISLNAVKSDSIAEEILQTSFLTIYSQINSYNPEKLRFHCWLLTILVQSVKDYYESKNIEYCLPLKNSHTLFVFR